MIVRSREIIKVGAVSFHSRSPIVLWKYNRIIPSMVLTSDDVAGLAAVYLVDS